MEERLCPLRLLAEEEPLKRVEAADCLRGFCLGLESSDFWKKSGGLFLIEVWVFRDWIEIRGLGMFSNLREIGRLSFDQVCGQRWNKT